MYVSKHWSDIMWEDTSVCLMSPAVQVKMAMEKEPSEKKNLGTPKA